MKKINVRELENYESGTVFIFEGRICVLDKEIEDPDHLDEYNNGIYASELSELEIDNPEKDCISFGSIFIDFDKSDQDAEVYVYEDIFNIMHAIAGIKGYKLSIEEVGDTDESSK